jgi:hypothetical protein
MYVLARPVLSRVGLSPRVRRTRSSWCDLSRSPSLCQGWQQEWQQTIHVGGGSQLSESSRRRFPGSPSAGSVPADPSKRPPTPLRLLR